MHINQSNIVNVVEATPSIPQYQTIDYADFPADAYGKLPDKSKHPTADEIASAIIRQLGLAQAGEKDCGPIYAEDAKQPSAPLLEAPKGIMQQALEIALELVKGPIARERASR